MAMTLRLTDAQQEALRLTAEREQRSMQAIASEAIDRYVSDRMRRRDEIIARVVRDHKVLLDRLA